MNPRNAEAPRSKCAFQNCCAPRRKPNAYKAPGAEGSGVPVPPGHFVNNLPEAIQGGVGRNCHNDLNKASGERPRFPRALVLLVMHRTGTTILWSWRLRFIDVVI